MNVWMSRTFVALFSLVLMTGCFEIDQSIELKKDLSGTADLHLGVDLEPMVMVMAQFAREMEGKTGPITEAELAKARAEFKKSSSSKKESSDTPSTAEIQSSLPEGVKLLDYKMAERDFGIVTDFKFGFDRIHQLVGVKLPSKGNDPSKKNVIDSPFDGMEVVENGDTITIRTRPVNPQEEMKKEAADAPKLDKEAEELVKAAFGKMRVTYRLTAPFTIVSHNATRREGNTLVWIYDLQRFEEMADSDLEDAGVRVTYKK